jgi:hypothetical protein
MNILICFIFGHNFITTANFLALRSISVNNMDVGNLSNGVENNILSCARRCGEDDTCAVLIYNEIEKLCGLKKIQNVSTEAQEISGTGYKV